MVVDINTGYSDSLVSKHKDNGYNTYIDFDMVVYHDKLYFMANDGIHGVELWAYDASINTTHLVADINTGEGGSAPSQFTVFEGKLYFMANDLEHGRELRVYDDATNEISLVTEVTNGEKSTYLKDVVKYNDTLYFTFSLENGFYPGGRLWQLDNKSNQLVRVDKINSVLSINSSLIIYNEQLFFYTIGGLYAIYDANNNVRLVTNLEDISPFNFTVYRDNFYFLSSGGAYGEPELWRYNVRSPELEKIDNGTYSKCADEYLCSPKELVVYNDKLYLDSYGGLVVFDADSDSINQISGAGFGFSAGFTIYQNKLFFNGETYPYGFEPHFYDDERGEIERLKDINQTPNGSMHFTEPNLTEYNNDLYFVADDGIHGQELWFYDKITNKTKLVVDINTIEAFPGCPGNSIPKGLTVVDDTLYFTANDGIRGRQLWQYDVTTNSAAKLSDFNPDGISDYNIKNLIGYNGKLYLLKKRRNGYRLLCYQCDDAGVSEQFTEISDVASSFIVTFDGKLVFIQWRGNDRYALMAYDDSDKTIVELTTPDKFPLLFAVYQNKLFYTSDFNRQLFFYDEDSQSVKIVLDFSDKGLFINSENMIVYGEALYFLAGNYADGDELWRYSFDTGMAIQVSDIPDKENSGGHLSVYKNQLFFAGNDKEHGRELWLYDSTSETTRLISDVLPGIKGAMPDFTLVYDNALWGKAIPEYNEERFAHELAKFSINRLPEISLTATETQVNEGEAITLNANAEDADKDELTYSWLQLSGSADVSIETTGTELHFIAPEVKKDEHFLFEVTVFDGMESASAQLSIQVMNKKSSNGGGSTGQYLLMLLLILFRLRTVRNSCFKQNIYFKAKQ